ncbi:MAG: hypothetical protein QG622_857 [Actinomycetota bacterium]|nr:hypothetical protein [Actinomycetota bacterium]
MSQQDSEFVLTGHPCGSFGSGPYASAAIGNDRTSCPFAMNVRLEYVRAGGNGSTATLRVDSPTTTKYYSMTCSGDQPVYCRGGDDALVYLYGGNRQVLLRSWP